MVIRAIIRVSSYLSRPKTVRDSRRRFHSETESNNFFTSTVTADPPPVYPKAKAWKASSFIKFAAFTTSAAILGTAGYATYAYTADEVDEKTKNFRSSINLSLVDSTFTIKDLPHRIYTAVMTIPSKAVNNYLNLRRLIEEHVKEIAEPVSDKLLPDMDEMSQQHRVMTLVLDVRETLIYSEWKRETGWRTYKRPGLDDFLQHMSRVYEIVIYDDKDTDPSIIEKLREKGMTHYLSKRDTKYQDGKHYRDLSKLNRDPSRIIYVSGHALDNCLQLENCIPIKPWKNEDGDKTLIDLIPFLEYVGMSSPEIKGVLASYKGKHIPTEFIERSKRVLNKQKPSPWNRRF
ncbi:mitochondrial import inner membrane translocase subunit TIM50-like [Silene latifolia]|uniref:mitochondrial import inner membrane translocase subunit TIM50-like n=1 Tax=Silene latifolia TaxID=37657 RepID=UPI003D76EEFF